MADRTSELGRGYCALVLFLHPNCQNKNEPISVNSSICFVTGFPALCSAFDSILNLRSGRVLRPGASLALFAEGGRRSRSFRVLGITLSRDLPHRHPACFLRV